MSRVKIITDSNSGITQRQGKEMGIEVVPMPFFINETQYLEDITMTQEDFYQALQDDRAEVSTSQPSPENIMEMWTRGLEEYDEIVHIPMSSGISSSCATAMMLAQEEEFEGRVYVVDNQRISVTQRRSVLQAKELADKGFSGKEISDILTRDKLESSIYIMVDTLKYLKKGGRLTPAVAAIGTVLRIKPVLQIQGDKLDSYAKVKTLKQAKQTMIKAITSDLEHRFADSGNMYIDIAHTQNREEAEKFREELNLLFPEHDIHIDPLSLSVSCHIGPGALAVTLSNEPKELK
ncbi:MAG: DegV family protein [Eubacterium sp.]|jgi:DegV family protein with EDD domain|nr:DegV family protein [Eubacterium sp.]